MKQTAFLILSILFSLNLKAENCTVELTHPRLVSAREFAIERHAGQKYGGRPYSVHLQAVEDVLREFGFSEADNSLHLDLLLAAWLHDVMEDTGATIEEVAKVAGPDAADFAYRVSDGEGETYDEKKLTAYAKTRGHLGATVLKLADRIANERASFSVPYKLNHYMDQYPKFRRELFKPEMVQAMPLWLELDHIFRRYGPSEILDF